MRQFWFALSLLEILSINIKSSQSDQLIREYWPLNEDYESTEKLTSLIISFSGQFQARLLIGTPPQTLQFKFSLEDDSIFIFAESCAFTALCNQNKSLAYFQPSRSTSFTTENRLFDGSIRGRFGPSGKIGRDVIRLNGFDRIIDFGIVDRSTFPIQADGVLGLGLTDADTFRHSLLFQLLRIVPFPQIGIFVNNNKNLSTLNSGLIFIGQRLIVGCVDDYQFVSLQYPERQWIIPIKSVRFDNIAASSRQSTASIQPGRFYTIAPDSFLTTFLSYIKASQPDSRTDEFYIVERKSNSLPMPDVTFELGGFKLTLRPKDYLSEITSYGRMILFKKRPFDYSGLQTDWVFGDNFLQTFCVVFEYTSTPRIGFARSHADQTSAFFLLIFILIYFYYVI